MHTERLQPRDIRLILAVLAIVVLSVIYARLNFTRAFPQASIDLRYSRDQITTMAADFLAARGLAPSGFRNVTVFDSEETARTYLERELGLEQANRLMGAEVPVWRWRARWLKPPEKEERIVWLTPSGTLVGFHHVIPEAEPGARLTQDQALRLAEQFLAARTRTPQRLIEQQRLERPNRYDYLFTWERENYKIKDATYRRSIVVQGGRVGEYREGLHIPEQWERDYAALRSRNDLFASIANTLYVPLALAALAVIIGAVRRRAIVWRPVLLVSGSAGILMVLNQWNSLAFTIDQMPTSATLGEMVSLGILQGLGVGVLVFFYVAIPGAAGEPLYRRMSPGRLPLRIAFSPQGLRTREFFLATMAGYGLAAFHIAFVVAFYVAAQRFGAWSPQDVQYSDLLSTWAPWLYPLAIAAMAASSEEFWFRLFGISLFRRYVKVQWLAIVAPAFIWGFLHSNYPQQPAWIRGIEVGLIGLVAGVVMLRFGIVATLVWHYTVDAVLIGLFLFAAPSLYFRLSGYVVGGVVLFPLAASMVLYLLRGGFVVPSPETVPEPEPEPQAPPAGEPAPAAEALPEEPAPRWPARWLAWAAAAALAAGIVFVPPEPGGSLAVRLTRGAAAQAAADSLRAQHIDVTGWNRFTEYIPNIRLPEYEYLRRQVGPHRASRLLREWTQLNIWRTNYFRPLQREEWYVYVDQNGKVFRTGHELGEDAPGANLTQDEALNIARAYAQSHGLAMDRYKLADAQTEKREKRTDHSFVWESLDFRQGDATARLSANVVGGEVSEFRRFIKLPEQWVREYEKPRLQAFLFPAVIGVAALPLLIVFLRRVAGHGGPPHRFHWRIYTLLGAAALILFVLSSVNQLPELWRNYSTDTPEANYLAGVAASRLILALLTGAGFFFGAMALDVFLQATIGRIPAGVQLWRAAAAGALIWGVGRVLAWCDQWLPGPRFAATAWNLPGAANFLPAFTVFQNAFSSGVLRTVGLGIAVAALIGFVSPRRRVPVIAGLLIVLAAAAPTFLQAAFAFLSGAVWVALAVFLLRTAAPSPATFGLAFFWLAAAGSAAVLLAQPNPWFRINGVLAILMAAAAGWWLARFTRRMAP